jgi:hypothetical protein
MGKLEMNSPIQLSNPVVGTHPRCVLIAGDGPIKGNFPILVYFQVLGLGRTVVKNKGASLQLDGDSDQTNPKLQEMKPPPNLGNPPKNRIFAETKQIKTK